MRFSLVTALVVGLAADVAVGSTWFGKAAYNKWHETELERWLSDHNVPYPTPSDRKDLELLVKDNWNYYVATPYSSWDTNQLSSYLTAKGHQAKKGSEKNKDSLVSQVKSYWTQTEDQASDSYSSVGNWILDTWTESQLKAFCDKNGIPAPQPRTRDSYLKAARENYQSVATKLGETAAYPGDWLYSSWSDSDLKAWCDERGVPVPQPNNRDSLIASVRRNSYVASSNFAAYTSSAASAAASATQALSDALLDSWSDSQIKEWADKNGIKVPQGSKRNELIALARKHRAKLTGDSVSASAASVYGAATSSAGNQYSAATSSAGNAGNAIYSYFDWATSQLGFAASSASASGKSLTGAAATSYSRSSSSASSAASRSSSSASSAASVSAKSLTGAAATSYSSSSSSASSVASRSSSSASSVAARSASSASSAWSSLSSAASSASSSASKKASKSGSKEAKKAGDAAAESVSKGKHRVQEAYQQATDYAKEEL